MKSISRIVVTLAATLIVPISCIVANGRAEANPAVGICRSTGPISVTQLGHRVNLRTCPIRGRLLELTLSGGQLGPGLYVPRSGLGVTNDFLTKTGEYVLAVTIMNDVLTINWSAPQRLRGFVAENRCHQPYYNLEGPIWETFGGTPVVAWHYKKSSVPKGLSKSATQADVRQASINMTHGLNNCGYVTGAFMITAAFKGDTSKSANIDRNGNCSSSFPDGQNTISWIAFSRRVPNLLAVTCWTDSTFPNGSKNMTEADIAIGSNRDLVDKLPKGCTSKYDLQSVLTHEWGHVLGLAHETRGPGEVMYPTTNVCTVKRRLGNGDWNGMLSMYG